MADLQEISVTNTKINEWEELTFNFAGKIGEGVSTGIDQIIVFPDFIPEGTTRSANHVCYVDNITFSAKIAAPVAATAPTVAAPTPPARVATDVKSVYSDAYAVYKAIGVSVGVSLRMLLMKSLLPTIQEN
jgi:hypothetical protein